MRARVVTVLVVLLAGPLAGCFGILEDDAGAGERTLGLTEDGGTNDPAPGADENATNETRERNARASLSVEVNASWQVGDQWYYESNHSRWRRITVENLSYVNGTPFFRVHTATGEGSYRASHNVWLTVNAITYNTTFLRHEMTSGLVTERTFSGDGHGGLRFLRNGTYTYDETGTSNAPGFSQEWTARYVVNVRPQDAWNETVLGTPCRVVWFDEYVSRWDPDRPSETLVTALRQRAYCAAIQNDVYVLGSTKELWTLRGFRLGDVEAGRGLEDPPRK